MRIATWHSTNAPAGKQWEAKWIVAVKPRSDPNQTSPDAAEPAVAEVFPCKPTKEGIMPYAFYAGTEAEAIQIAQAAWNEGFGKRQQRIDENKARQAVKREAA